MRLQTGLLEAVLEYSSASQYSDLQRFDGRDDSDRVLSR